LGTTIKTFSGVELHHYNTFPSGHSITVFSIFSFLALITRPGWGYLWALMAVLGIYSRVVVGLHFVTDITAGAIIGWLSTWFAWRAAWSFKYQGLNGHWKFR
jgi:membrane-associated phospholipid phosphatase